MDTPTLIGGGFVILGFVVWLTLTYYAAKMATARGRRPGVWAAITFLTFGIGIFVLAVLPSKKGTSGHRLQ
jgi:uncharacterized membrane-anchored protein